MDTMLTQASEMVMVGLAQRPGTESPCADGADFQRRGSRVCAVVVDGAGHGEEVVRYAATVPAVITQMGMVEGGLAGLVTGGRMAYAYNVPSHASAVYASVDPGRRTRCTGSAMHVPTATETANSRCGAPT